MLTTTRSSASPQWLDTNLYPFEHHFFQLDKGKMHYIDEGAGEVILFVHGTPTWSFLYREFVKELSSSYRCIAVDHLGFGLSDKPVDFPGRPEDHAAHLAEFITRLNLQNITLVVHDFGGPIGLGAALEIPDRIKQVVLFNTWLWETKSNPAVKKVNKLINSILGRFLYLHLNFSPKVLLKKGFADRKKLPRHIHQHYINPFPDKTSRHALLSIAKSLYGASDWYQQQWRQLHLFSQKPWLILWGAKDEFITSEYLDQWASRLSQAKVKTFECGHFVQEEKPAEAIMAMKKFLGV